MKDPKSSFPHRRAFLASVLGAAGSSAVLPSLLAAEKENVGGRGSSNRGLRITKLETMMIQPRWLFLKVHTDAGIVGMGEPILEGRPQTCAAAVKEIADSSAKHGALLPNCHLPGQNPAWTHSEYEAVWCCTRNNKSDTSQQPVVGNSFKSP